MEIRILGPLEVLDGTRPIPVEGPRQRALLALLATRPNQVLSADHLVAELWGENPPGGAANALQAAVSRLRRALEGAPAGGARSPRILTRSPGYVLEVDPEAIDAARFEHLVAEARRALADGDSGRAASLLREALSLWQGRWRPGWPGPPSGGASGPSSWWPCTGRDGRPRPWRPTGGGGRSWSRSSGSTPHWSSPSSRAGSSVRTPPSWGRPGYPPPRLLWSDRSLGLHRPPPLPRSARPSPWCSATWPSPRPWGNAWTRRPCGG